MLVALPQSPETRRLDRHPDAARAARDKVLARMVEEGRVCYADPASMMRACVMLLRHIGFAGQATRMENAMAPRARVKRVFMV